jgi:DegV family protein with EDD domain
MGIRVVTDSACDLPASLIEALGIEIVPLTIRFGDEEFVDRVELSADEFWERLEHSDTLPETAAPSPGAFETCFRDLAARGATGIVCINLSSHLSGTMQSAQVAAKALDGEIPVTVVDSKTVSMGLGSQCVSACALAADGADLATIAARAEQIAQRTRLLGALDTLEHLRRGGRIGGAQAMLGSMLSIKPVIEVRDGVVAESGKVRTRSKSLVHLAEKLSAADDPQDVYVFHAQAPDIDEFLERVSTIVPLDRVEVGEIGPVIGTHTGPRTIGLGWVDAG